MEPEAGAASPARRKRLRLHLITWNVGTASPPPDVTSLLQLSLQGLAVDIYVVGLQEVNSKIVNFLSDMAFDDPWSIFFERILSPLSYIKVSSIRMQGLLLLIFAKHAHIPFIREIQSQFTRTGLYRYWGNKGAVSTRMSLYGHMVCFVNCHLPAHMENAEQRLDDFEHILEMQQFEGETVPGVLDHDFPPVLSISSQSRSILFWFGDLNFRIEDYGLHFIRESINKNRFSLLWEKDQLNMAKKKEGFLQEFREGPLQFKPTYKFDLYSNEYDTSGKKRKPAWTDRILWRVKSLLPRSSEAEEEPEEQPVSVSLNSYASHMGYSISDHKPVSGTFELELKPLVSIPLVTLHPVGSWSSGQDVTVSYSALPELPHSAWDWIGLYKVTFRHANDYAAYAWVQDNEISSGEDAKQVYLSTEGLTTDGEEFLLGYYSHTMQSIVGLSPHFQIQPSRMVAEKDLAWDGEALPCGSSE
ncbi:inositol polyphosphate 5-phosphatase K isoform X2 [Sphaerodactylus townsendi]|uniref:inositol polyphosphate 5-phosphatase K isoform X2 n=1 Tax=Sphaerodactylus townsendi TaxID=933632 RepID=UPI002026AB59|nr:inositol polyphosphate 5-phosphatase K isoform X2 [Sphaerodactylus townsendi]